MPTRSDLGRGAWVALAIACGCGRIEFDTGSGADASSGDALAARCPGTGGPVMVEVPAATGAYCIDSTEVTRAHYQAFLAALPSVRTPECAGNADFLPDPVAWPPAGAELDHPVVGVDWCDAQAFCAWAGKRLCGAIGGGGLTVAAATGATSQWFHACSGGGVHAYPYGDSFIDGQCSDGPDVIGVATKPGCTGGFPGVFDMSGNVHEWIDACTGNNCTVIGGGIGGHAGSDMDCNSTSSMPRSIAGNGHSWTHETGFRCCS